MYIFEILPITKNRFADTLTYFYGEKIEEGQIVKIPFRKQDIKGIILSSQTAEEGKAFIKSLPYKLRAISKIENEKITLYYFRAGVFGWCCMAYFDSWKARSIR